MNNSAQVQNFFRKMADGLVLNSKKHDSTAHAVRNSMSNRNENWSQTLVDSQSAPKKQPQCSDYGVGLPPLSHS